MDAAEAAAVGGVVAAAVELPSGGIGYLDFKINYFDALSVGDILQNDLLPAALRNEFFWKSIGTEIF